ncbi:ABC transporter ATP-binding protein [Paenibacillus crassostreae]|uniref:ABC transporter ATP-binding protein n=1 Tax=Paenibacillus crassostreae TaxID=1763538 RepID=A0A167G389_9BACL|nr:ABC transporter ATP-binding protein [Paenibacillus crassostreae]AOZ93802.1 ABC transporter ATP-binding protein [Paenibacillus crassostreae]OAB77164.1 ABC transporter ATP-binding protein [Paenibacillus crassostreae]
MLTCISFLKKYKVATYASIVMMLIELMVELMQPFIISKMIDDGIRQGELRVVLMWGGILVVMALLALTSGLLSSFFASHVSQSFAFDLREKVYAQIQSYSLAVFDRFASSSLITRLTNDVTQLQNTIFMGLRIMMRAPLLVVGSVIMAFVVYPKLAVLLILTVPILLIFLFWVMKKAGRLFRNVQMSLDAVNSVIQENLIGMRLIRVFGRMRHEVIRFSNTSKELMERTISVLRLTELTMPFILLIMNAGIIAVLWFGQIEIDTGDATIGEVVAVVNYSMRTTGALSVFSMIVVNFSRARASAQRIAEVIETKSDLLDVVDGKDNKHALLGNIKFDSVSFRYPGSKSPILQNISFEANEGNTIAIMGMTGSGKSSLLGLILRLYEQDEGRIIIDGKDLHTIEIEHLRGEIGYVPQEVMLFAGTIHDNIAWGKLNASREEIRDAAKLAQIHDSIIELPLGYDTMLGQKGINLSGGQKQRLTIARALVRQPKILLLDDSTSALDVRTEAALLEDLKKVSCTTFIITQKVRAAIGADLILLLDDGHLIAQGSHDELLTVSDLYQDIYASQIGEEGISHVERVK